MKEWLTDTEKRILFSALTREKDVCMRVDRDGDAVKPYEQSLQSVCESLEHKFYYDKLFKQIERKTKEDCEKWNDILAEPDILPRPNEWVLVYQRYSKPNYTIGRLHFETLPDGKYKNYWEWFSNQTIGSPMICPGTEYVYGWKEIPSFIS